MTRLYAYLCSIAVAIVAYFAHISTVKRKAVKKYKQKVETAQTKERLTKVKEAIKIEQDLNKTSKEAKREELESLIRDTTK